MAEQEVVEQEDQDRAIEQEARDLGWAPKDEFRGDENRWVDAKTFVERGKTMLPLVKKQNEELRGQIAELTARDRAREGELKGLKTALRAVEAAQDEDLSQRVEDMQEELAAEIAEASREGDHERVAKLTKDLIKLNVSVATKEKKEEEEEEPSRQEAVQPSPDYLAWAARNPWVNTDMKRARLLQVAAMNVKEDKPGLRGASFFDAVDDELARLEGRTKKPRGESRVAGGGARPERDGGGSGGGKGYADLPADAKAACESYAKQFVGEGKRYKDANAWRAKYAAEYFKGDEE